MYLLQLFCEHEQYIERAIQVKLKYLLYPTSWNLEIVRWNTEGDSLFSLLLSILWLAGSWILLQECKHPTSFFQNKLWQHHNKVVTTSFYQTIPFIAKNRNLPKSSLFKCYDSNLHWWLSPKASRSQSSVNRELSIIRRDFLTLTMRLTLTCMSSRVLMAVRKCSLDLLHVTSFCSASELSVN